MRAGTWGDRQAERPPYYVQINNRVVTPAEFERQKMEFMRGAVITNPPDVKPLTLEEAGKIALTMVLAFVAIWFVLTFLR